MIKANRPVPIYTSLGDFEAFLIYPMIFNITGEWIGFVTRERDVYSVHGEYVGWLSDDPRILRKRSYDYVKPKLTPPQGPSKSPPPASVPLAPMMPELRFDTIDVLQEEPERMPTVDAGEFRPDMD